ncbi:hypothetical protein R3P82_11415, partial [Dietzia maris]|nr:hypothetical protein [Dietzia maris]
MAPIRRRVAAFVSSLVLAATTLVVGQAPVVSAQPTTGIGPVSDRVDDVGTADYANWIRTVSEGAPRQGDLVSVTNVIEGNDVAAYTNILWMKEFHPSCLERQGDGWSISGHRIGSPGELGSTSPRSYSPTDRADEMDFTFGTEGGQVTTRAELADTWPRLRINGGNGDGLTTTWTETYRVTCAPGSISSGGFTWDDSRAVDHPYETSGPTIMVRPALNTTITTLTVDPDPEENSESILSAMVTNGRDGDVVEFYDGAVRLGTSEVSSGVAVFPWRPGAGTANQPFALVAKYLGSADHAPSDSAPTTGTIAGDITAPAPPTDLVIAPQPVDPGQLVAVSGEAEPFSTVRVYVGAGDDASCSATANPAGEFSCSFTAIEQWNGLPVTATAADAAGNVSDEALAGTLGIAPSQPPVTVTATITATEVTTAVETTTQTSTATVVETTTEVVPTTVPTTVVATTTELVPTTEVETETETTTAVETSTVTETPPTVTETLPPTTVRETTTAVETSTVTETPPTVTETLPPTTVSTTVRETTTQLVPTTAFETETETTTVTSTERETTTVPTTVRETTTAVETSTVTETPPTVTETLPPTTVSTTVQETTTQLVPTTAFETETETTTATSTERETTTVPTTVRETTTAVETST